MFRPFTCGKNLVQKYKMKDEILGFCISVPYLDISLYCILYKMIFTTVVTEINSLFMRLIKLRDTQSDCSGTLKSQPPKFSGRKICSEAK